VRGRRAGKTWPVCMLWNWPSENYSKMATSAIVRFGWETKTKMSAILEDILDIFYPETGCS